MADIKKLTPFILKWEGGFVNDPADLGGATNKGVTFKTFKDYCKKKGLTDACVKLNCMAADSIEKKWMWFPKTAPARN